MLQLCVQYRETVKLYIVLVNILSLCAAVGSYIFGCPNVLNDHFPCVKMSPTFVFSQRACYILSGSFSTSANDNMINVFTLVRASQDESPNSRYPEIPIAHEQSFIRIAPSPLDSLESPLLLETLLLLRDSLTTSMLDLRKKTIKGFRSNQTLLGLTLYS